MGESVNSSAAFTSEVESLARSMIARHGRGAARAAAEQLNLGIDQGDLYRRDLWAQVVHAIHEAQQHRALAAIEDGRVKRPPSHLSVAAGR